MTPPGATVAGLRNLGPVMAEQLIEIGIDDRSRLDEAGAVPAFLALRHRFGRRVSTIALYALEGALTDRDWRALSPEEKAALRRVVDRAGPDGASPPSA